jgi:hypothetical protein
VRLSACFEKVLAICRSEDSETTVFGIADTSTFFTRSYEAATIFTHWAYLCCCRCRAIPASGVIDVAVVRATISTDSSPTSTASISEETYVFPSLALLCRSFASPPLQSSSLSTTPSCRSSRGPHPRGRRAW